MASANDSKAVELGVRFSSASDGYISGIRFFKGSLNTGVHTGSLWDASGNRLATATFTNETGSGWQEVRFASPVPITANTTYVASYFAPRGRYAFDASYFAVSGVSNGQITVRPTRQGGGGTFAYGGGFPTQSYQDGNYWVDVVFATEAVPPTVTSVTPADQATNVDASSTVKVAFSEAVDPATVSAATFFLKTAAGATVSATVSYDAATRTATLTSSSALSAGTGYAVTVRGGVGTTVVRDLAGNALDADFTSTFTTASVASPPTANAGADKSGNEGSSVSFTGTASGGTGTLTYHWNFGDGGTADGTLTPTHSYADNGTYTVTLTVTDGASQTASDTATVTVSNVAPTASLSNNGPVNAGANVTISFGSQSDVSSADQAAGYRYSYDFDNNGTWEQTDVTSATATTSYATAGSKTVKARIKDKDGGFTDYTTTVIVNGPPTANAGADKTSNEAASVSFTGSASGGVGTLTYHWDFGDGGTANGTLTPSHTYADNGTYTVTLTVTDGASQTASDTATVTVSNVAPTASLSNNGPVYTNGNVTISFAGQTDVSSVDRTAGYRYSYDFDNNGTWEQTDVTTATATTSYATAGNKTVKARDKDKDGGFTDYTTVVSVVGLPTAGAGADKSSNEASSVSFTGTASGGMGTLTYHWDFGDGGTTDGTLTPSHTFADNGVYTVTLTVTDGNNQTASDTATVTVSNIAPTASLSNNGPVYTNGNVTISFAGQTDVSSVDRTAGYRYSYDFDNNGTWEQTDVTTATATTSYATTGNKTVKSRIKDKDGGFTDYTTVVSVVGLPAANAGADKNSNEGSSVSFTGTTTGGIGTLTYHWDFGDGGTANGTLSPNHSFTDNGVYTVTLTVTDGNNQSASDTATVTVSNVAPTATVSNNGPVNTGANVTISFASQNDVSSVDHTAGYRYSYDFDNNGTWEQTDVTTATATTSYASAGSKTVKTRIKDKDGGFTDYTTVVVVTDGTQSPTYYVSPTGNDANNGSSGLPWRTLQKASNMAQPGDTIIVRAGNYNGFAVARSGTAANRITFKADPGAVIDTADTSLGIDVGIIGSGREYITIEGFTFQPKSGQPQWDAAIRFNGGATGGVYRFGNIYRNNVAKLRVGGAAADTYYHTLYASWQDGVLIEGNTIQDGYNSGIYVANSSKNYTVRGNTVSGVGGNGIHNNGDLSAGSPGINKFALIEGNTIFNVGYGMGGQAISFDGVQDSVIRNNLLYNIHAKGISLYNTNGAAGSMRNVIANNTVIMASDGYTPLRLNHNASTTTVFNNIFIAASSTAPWTDSEESGLSGSKFDYNVTFGRAMVGGVVRNDWKTSYGFDAHSISSTAALLFMNPVANDFRLLAASPAINIGIATFNGKSAPATDILGNARPFGLSHDIGAYEFVL